MKIQLLLCLMMFLLLGCSANVNSFDGSVPIGAKAYSPNGLFYAREIQPIGTGQIGVFKRIGCGGSFVCNWNVLPYIRYINDLKGMAWSKDSTKVAVMYHGGAVIGSGVYVFELHNEKLIAFAETKNFYHGIEFNGLGNGVWLYHRGGVGKMYLPLQLVDSETQTNN